MKTELLDQPLPFLTMGQMQALTTLRENMKVTIKFKKQYKVSNDNTFIMPSKLIKINNLL